MTIKRDYVLNQTSEQAKSKHKKFSDWHIIFSLIFAGEMIFSVPFHVARFFRPTLLDSFSLSNADLGDTFAVFGITAMISYFPGGIIADYFSARRLLTFSLLYKALIFLRLLISVNVVYEIY